MDLSVYLTIEEQKDSKSGEIYIRKDGRNVSVTYEEFKKIYPDREPIITSSLDDDEVFWANITHNLGSMADAAGIYEALWKPEDIKAILAKDLIEPLEKGLIKLKSDPDSFRKFNPENGWGNYEALVGFVEEYLKACQKWPTATIRVSR